MNNSEIGFLIAVLACIIGGAWVVKTKEQNSSLNKSVQFFECKRFYKDALGWGFLLWLIGYVLGFILFFFVSPAILGWIIMPIGIIITLWVLLKKVKRGSLKYFFFLAVIWSLLAAILDYLFIVITLKPEGGYYKLDVYIYYVLIFALPLLVGWRKSQAKKIPSNI